MLLTSPDAKLNSQIELTNTIQLTSREIVCELFKSYEDTSYVELGRVRLNEEWLTLPEPYKQDIEDELYHYLDAALAKIQNNIYVTCLPQDATYLIEHYLDSRPAWLKRLEDDIASYLHHFAFLKAMNHIEFTANACDRSDVRRQVDNPEDFPDISFEERSPFITRTGNSYTFKAKVVLYPAEVPGNPPCKSTVDFIPLDETNCYAFATVRLNWQRGE